MLFHESRRNIGHWPQWPLMLLILDQPDAFSITNARGINGQTRIYSDIFPRVGIVFFIIIRNIYMSLS